MIKANELRIGNYYDQFGYIEQVNGTIISQLEKAPESQIWCKPIPITEEWLKRFGFTDNGYTFDLGELSFSYASKIVETGYRSGWSCEKYDHIKYVHQLQNLYYILCGEELKEI